MALKLYGFPLSTYVRTARMACVEKGVAYELEPLSPPECKARGLHPFGKIPVMEHDGLRLFETSAIVRYIDETFDGPPLQPGGRIERARMEQWISCVNDTIYDAMVRRCILQYAFPRGEDGAPDRSIIVPALKQTRRQLKVLDEAYGDGDFLVGADPSIADLFLAPILFYLARIPPEGAKMLESAPNVGRGMAAMESRKSFVETIPPEAA